MDNITISKCLQVMIKFLEIEPEGSIFTRKFDDCVDGLEKALEKGFLEETRVEGEHKNLLLHFKLTPKGQSFCNEISELVDSRMN